jgi:flagellar basal body rod protein FlgF
MKVVCNRVFKSQGLQYELTYGKVYDTLPSSNMPLDEDNWWIVNDRNQSEYYFKNIFVTIEEWREIQLNKLV